MRAFGPRSDQSRRGCALRRPGGHFDAAILDINLGDGMAYPVADILAARGIPFVFVTGYEANTVDERFSDVPVLQKPIERQTLQRLFIPNVDVAAVTRSKPVTAAKAQARG